VRAIDLDIGFQGGGFEAFNVGTGVNHSVMDMIGPASSKRAKNRSFYTLLYTQPTSKKCWRTRGKVRFYRVPAASPVPDLARRGVKKV
jgi:hypothetical protein